MLDSVFWLVLGTKTRISHPNHCMCSHWRHCKPLLNADADVFHINVKPHSITQCGVTVRLRPANHDGANFRIGLPKNTLGAVLWSRAPSESPQEWTRSCHSCPSWTTLHVCGIYGVALSPILLTFLNVPFSLIFLMFESALFYIVWETLYSFSLLLFQ